MAILKWLILAERAIQEKDRNTLSIIELVEGVTVAGEYPEAPAGSDGLPMIHFPFTVISLWERSDLEIPEVPDIKLSLFAPDGKTILGGHQVFADLGVFQRTRVISLIPGIPFAGPGRYSVVAEIQTPEGGAWAQVGEEGMFVGKKEDFPTVSKAN